MRRISSRTRARGELLITNVVVAFKSFCVGYVVLPMLLVGVLVVLRCYVILIFINQVFPFHFIVTVIPCRCRLLSLVADLFGHNRNQKYEQTHFYAFCLTRYGKLL
eukprot:GEMP01142029.1.p1 GENE.GEMP01142029.1~~GEMP01142029.1.p1  ORF type:complete len:106 (-),score=0.38 GEMP01142029.1:138-455(-)